MKNHIKVIPRYIFKEIFEGAKGLMPEYAVISIHEPRNKIFIGGYAEAWPIIIEDAPNVLNLWFNDAEEYNPATETVLFDEDMADSVVRFVEANKDAKAWVLHCTAGISRSGAVGGFIADYLGIYYKDFKIDNPQVQPNALVKKLLTRRLLEK